MSIGNEYFGFIVEKELTYDNRKNGVAIIIKLCRHAFKIMTVWNIAWY